MKLGNVNTAMIKDRYVKNAFDSHLLGFRSILFTSASGVILDFSGFLLGFVLLALLATKSLPFTYRPAYPSIAL